MSGGFQVDYEGLSDLGSNLSALQGQFASGDGVIEPMLQTVSDPGLKGALNSFATNWSDERQKLDARLQKAASYATQAAKTYRDGDTTTASGFHTGGK